MSENISDTVGAMFSSNTESGITVTYEDSDNTIDLTVGTLNQNTTGNAATATVLETARTIGGVSFNGSANINLPGVNSAGNQNTSGNATTATTADLATYVTASANNSTDETVYITFVDGTSGTQGIETDSGLTYNPSSGVLTSTTFAGALSGNASTATTLANARTIGGTSFDGSANIAVALASTATTLATARTIGGVSFDGFTAIVPNTVSIADEESQNSNRLICFADSSGTNNMAKFGTSGDLQISHNGSQSIITDTAHPVFLKGNQVHIQSANGNMISCY